MKTVKIGAVLTSVGGPVKRVRADGEDVGAAWLEGCQVSWMQFGAPVISIAEVPPPPELDWFRTDDRPSIAQMLGAAAIKADQHALLLNADILLNNDYAQILGKLERDAMYIGHRVDVTMSHAGNLVSLGAYQAGFDHYLVPAALLKRIVDEQLLPKDFRIGEPWWDYALPLLALAMGTRLVRLPEESGALHYWHSTHYDSDLWMRNGMHLLQMVKRLRNAPGSKAVGLFDEVLAVSGPVPERLNNVGALICKLLP